MLCLCTVDLRRGPALGRLGGTHDRDHCSYWSSILLREDVSFLPLAGWLVHTVARVSAVLASSRSFRFDACWGHG